MNANISADALLAISICPFVPDVDVTVAYWLETIFETVCAWAMTRYRPGEPSLVLTYIKYTPLVAPENVYESPDAIVTYSLGMTCLRKMLSAILFTCPSVNDFAHNDNSITAEDMA